MYHIPVVFKRNCGVCAKGVSNPNANFLDTQVSLAPTPVSLSVRRKVTLFRISILSASLSPQKATRRDIVVADMAADMEVYMVANMEVDKVADMEVDMVVDLKVDLVADMVG